MFKKNIILWISAALIVFLSLYLKKITSSDYPVTGVISIENSELLYRLEKTSAAREPIKIFIQCENENLSAEIKWKTFTQKAKIIPMSFSKGAYSAFIPQQNAGDKIFYQIILKSEEAIRYIPRNNFIQMKIIGKVPAQLNFYYSLFLILGMILSVRTALEYFNEQPKIKKLAFITVFFYFGYLIFTPLKLTYEIGAINRFVPVFSNLFNLQSILFLSIWILATIGIFQSRHSKLIALTTGIISLVVLFLC